MSTFKNKNSLRTIEAQIVQKLKNNEARPKFTLSLSLRKLMNLRNAIKKAFPNLILALSFLEKELFLMELVFRA